ncbi:FAD/NAD(P)-binding domain-containing protein [Xylaria scruposa]|nr:FAD/NAD(P)-binding domain-containing protein [Xylaria scruposa]
MDRLISATLDNVARLCEANFYHYIIIGSGIGGGILARTLVEESDKSRVLIIERGGLLLHTHSINLATPRWNHNSSEGPSQDNDLVYSKLKDPFVTVTAKSEPYAGGPVYGIGGRSTVWGLYTPKVDENDLQSFPEAIRQHLAGRGYNDAYQLMTGDREASLDTPYPHPAAFPTINAEAHNTIIDRLNTILRDPQQKVGFKRCPMAVEFTARNPGSRLYQVVKGGYSTAPWILDQIFNQSEQFHLLSQTRVMTVNEATEGGQTKIESLTVVDQRGHERTFSIGKAKVILSAGTVDTAAIALRSGVGNHNFVGHGLTDHDIWGTRFMFQPSKEVEALQSQAFRLQTTVELGSGRNTTHCLLIVTVNASSFLGNTVDRSFPCQFINSKLEIVPEEEWCDESCDGPTKSNLPPRPVVQVVYCLPSKLVKDNKVLNLPNSTPSIQITKRDKSIYASQMERIAGEIRTVLSGDKVKGQMPQVTRSSFGSVAHEVGTMRMGEKADNSVVDENLQVHNSRNLFVCDLSVFPISPSSNPTLTLAALSQRLGHHLIKHHTP